LNDADEKVGQILELSKKPEYKDGARKAMEAERKKLFAHAMACEAQLSRVVGSARKFQFLRDVFLISGFAAIFFARVLQPYEANYAPPAAAIYRIMNVTPPQEHPQASQANMPAKPTEMLPVPPGQPTFAQPHPSTDSLLSQPAKSAQTNPQQKPLMLKTNQP